MIIAVSTLMLSTTVWAPPMHSVMLSVPDYPEEALTWCGPATGQMIMEGYPTGTCSYLQEDVWMAIQTYKTEAMWDTDPVGLKEAMKHLCPPVGTWVVYAKTDSHVLMHSVAYWMTKNSYPVAILLNTLPHNSYTAHAEHWVAVRGIITDLDPTTNPSVNLQFVWFNDPAVPLGDISIERFVSGSTWYSEFQKVTKTGSSYNGKYVAVIEPPAFKGWARAPLEVLQGRIIKPEQALEHALKWIEEYKPYKMKPYEILKKAKPLKPLLVNEKYGAYYIIPFASKEKKQLARAAIIINAYNGNFQEVGAFKPTKYMPEEKAVRIALEQLKVKKPKKIEAELIFPTEKRVVNKYFPLWQIKVDKKVLHIDRQERIYTKLIDSCCVHFENPRLGTKYKVRDKFKDSCAKITVQAFQWSNSKWTNNGFAKVGNAGRAGGSNQEIEINNINLAFDFNTSCKSLSFLFGEYGGNLNIGINGDFRNFENFADINGTTIGGVNVSVVNGFGNDKGVLKLSGKIIKSKFTLGKKDVWASIIIGGQELWIDDVCCHR